MRHIRKLLLAILSFFLPSMLWAERYYIFHSSGMALSAVDGRPNLHTFDATPEQMFEVEKSGGRVLLKNVKNGRYVAKTGNWDTEYSTSNGDNAQYLMESNGGGYVKFKCRANGLYLGTDGTSAGSNVFSDKNGGEILHSWYLRSAESGELIKDGLRTTIEKAESRLKTTTAGDGEGQYSEKIRLSLQAAIDAAVDILDAAKTQSEFLDATSDLNAAIKKYNEGRNPAFAVGKNYYVMHASNRFLANAGGSVQIKNRDNSPRQQFVLESLSNGYCALKNVDNGRYLSKSGDYSVAWVQDGGSADCRLKIDYAPGEDQYVRLQFQGSGKYLGTDGTTDGKGVYSDKSGTDGKHYWMLLPVSGSSQEKRTSFKNGSPALRLGLDWPESEGRHINAHGGCVLYEDGVYYWFGENYRQAPVRSNGIVCYTSTDLYNWKYECMAYKCPEAPLRSDYQDMNYGRTLERPKVMFCPNTGKYTMWVHWENGSGYAASRVAVLVSDKITGPYTFLKTMRPRGDAQPSGSRDQTLMFDPDYNVGYHFGSAEENMTMHGTLLTQDFLDLSSTWERIFVKKQYEAPAVFKYHGRFVAITSGCTGWDPNPAHSSYSMMPLSGWNDSGNPCVDAEKQTTYHSQSNYVFKVPGLYDAYIYMGDRWKGGDYFSDANVGESWHIWLPIDMRSGYPVMRYYGEWDLSIFDKINRYRRVAGVEDGKTYLLLSKNANKILSEKNGQMQLTEDDDDINLSFSVRKNGDGSFVFVEEKTGQALDATGGNLTLNELTGGESQKWLLRDCGTHDGYYYIVPKNDIQKCICNYGATASANGLAGLGEKSDFAACQFAFCFDSQKQNMEPVAEEGDGQYDKWMQSMGYQKKEIASVNKQARGRKDCEISVFAREGSLVITPLKEETVWVWNANGYLIVCKKIQAGETLRLKVSDGIYVVNGHKVVVSDNAK